MLVLIFILILIPILSIILILVGDLGIWAFWENLLFYVRGNRLAYDGGTARPHKVKAFLITESKKPFRQAWLGNYPKGAKPWQSHGNVGFSLRHFPNEE